MDFPRFWEGFWKDLGLISGWNFVFFWKIAILSKLTKTSKKPRFLQCFLRFELVRNCKNLFKNNEKSMQISNREICRKKPYQNSIWEGVGLFCWGVWNGLGRLLGTLGCLLPVFFRRKSICFATLVQHGLQEPVGTDFGKVLEGSGRAWGRFLDLFYQISFNFWATERSWNRPLRSLIFWECEKMKFIIF